MTTDSTAPAPTRRSPVLLLGAGLVALVVGLVLASGVADGAAAAAQEHLALAAADPDGALARCAPGFRPAPTREERSLWPATGPDQVGAFRAFVATHPEWYQAAAVRFTDRRAEGGRVTLSGAAISRAGEATPVEVVVVETDGVWRVASVGRPR